MAVTYLLNGEQGTRYLQTNEKTEADFDLQPKIARHITVETLTRRHIMRLPIFAKKAFKKMKTFFFSKKHSFFVMFCYFSNSKKLIIKAEKTFLRNIIFWYTFYSKPATFSDFEKLGKKTFHLRERFCLPYYKKNDAKLQDGRLPPAYFPPSYFGRDAF